MKDSEQSVDQDVDQHQTLFINCNTRVDIRVKLPNHHRPSFSLRHHSPHHPLVYRFSLFLFYAGDIAARKSSNLIRPFPVESISLII